MLIGEHLHSVDPKGRIIIPLRFREDLGWHFVMTKGFDKCLYVYSIEQWNKILQNIDELPAVDAELRKFIRFFVGSAIECEPDNNGRTLIPQCLREFAGLEKEVVLVGLSSKVEIWDKNGWEAYNKEQFVINDELAGKISQLKL